MERFITKQLLDWRQSLRRKPLVLQGSRQVGKTYILRELGKSEFKNYVYCNFERDRALQRAFESSLAPDRIIQFLTAYFGASIAAQETLIIFDEIQECGPALTSLKYFFEDAPQYAVVAAGSLLGVTLAEQTSFPVGAVEFLNLEPLSFFEFVTALGRGSLIEFLREQSFDQPIPPGIGDELAVLLAQYQLVGGMPEAVQTFVDKHSYDTVRQVHEAVLKSYINDFAKHAPRNEVAEILSVWDVLPSMLGRENKKFTFSAIRPGARASEFEPAIRWLVQSGVVRQIRRVSRPGRPLAAYQDPKAFKLYFNDVGLLCTLMNISPALLLSPDKLLAEYSGAVAECFVAEELSSLGFRSLHYWTSQGSAEVDFILELDDIVAPLEVKAGNNLKSRSLTAFIEKYKPELALRGSLRNINRSATILNCPLYALALLHRYTARLSGAGARWR